MIIAFATQKGGTGKTTLAIAFANYLTQEKNKEVVVFDFDFQRSLYYKWKEDEETLKLPPLYEVEFVEDADEWFNMDDVLEMNESETIYLFDLAGTLDASYTELLSSADYIVIPFEYSDVSCKSTMVFINYLGYAECFAEKIFVRSKYDKGYNYLNQEGMDKELSKYGKIIDTPVYKRNNLQTINTRKLSYDQKYAVKNTFEELLEYINGTKTQTTI